MADPIGRGCTIKHVSANAEITPWRSYAEWMYAGMLSKDQVNDIYTNLGQGGLLALGSIGPHGWFVVSAAGSSGLLT